MIGFDFFGLSRPPRVTSMLHRIQLPSLWLHIERLDEVEVSSQKIPTQGPLTLLFLQLLSVIYGLHQRMEFAQSSWR